MPIFPNITTQRLAVKLTSAGEKKVKQGHPWVFESSIVKLNKTGKAGDIAIVFDARRDQVCGVGLYDPNSPIRIKMLANTAIQVNQEFFLHKIVLAFKKRHSLLKTDTNSYRLLFGENDGFPGLIVDVYATVMVLKIYSTIWYPYLNTILPLLKEIAQVQTIVVRLSRMVAREKLFNITDGQVIEGSLLDERVIFKEHGIRFSANVIHGHKTGYFLDHRHNRKRVGDMAQGKTVLDVFSYAGGFSVHALVGGARKVVSLDISAQALEVALNNGKLNDIAGKHETIAIDAFVGLQDLIATQETFDIVVIDPPSFAKSKNEIESAKNSYFRLASLGSALVNNNGVLILASCSSRVNAQSFFDISEQAIRRAGRKFSLLQKTYHDSDHPISFLEGAYLKCGYYRLS